MTKPRYLAKQLAFSAILMLAAAWLMQPLLSEHAQALEAAEQQVVLQAQFDAVINAAESGLPTNSALPAREVGQPSSLSSPQQVGEFSPHVAVDGPVGRIEIPKIGADWVVVGEVSLQALTVGPGIYPNTAALDSPVGRTVIAGHRTTHGAPFNQLHELEIGDPIYVTDSTGARYEYVVTPFEGQQGPSQIVAPSFVEILDQDNVDGRFLTLQSCNPIGSAAERILVDAVLVNVEK